MASGLLHSAALSQKSQTDAHRCRHVQSLLKSHTVAFPLWFIPGDWIWFPVLYSRTLLFILSKCNSLHLLTPNSHSIPPPRPLLLGDHKSVLYVCEYMCINGVTWLQSRNSHNTVNQLYFKENKVYCGLFTDCLGHLSDCSMRAGASPLVGATKSEPDIG